MYGIQGNELRFVTIAIDKDTDRGAEVHLPDQCSIVGFETPAGLVSTSCVIQKMMSNGNTFKQIRDEYGAKRGGYSVVAASEPYGVRPEIAAQIGSNFKILFPLAETGRSVVVWYRALL